MAPLVKCLLHKVEDANSVSSTQIKAGPAEGIFDSALGKQGQEDPWGCSVRDPVSNNNVGNDKGKYSVNL